MCLPTLSLRACPSSTFARRVGTSGISLTSKSRTRTTPQAVKKTVRALLYRGTPSNPAFWTRALLDLPFAAAVMARAVGPSGRNDEYLYNLDDFLWDAAERTNKSAAAARAALDDHAGDADTRALASMCRKMNDNSTLHFLFGAGSDQHGQLRLRGVENDNNAAGLVCGDEAREVKEIALAVPRERGNDDRHGEDALVPHAVYAGGAHSALLTRGGRLYLWGWNDHGQLGRRPNSSDDGGQEEESLVPLTPPLDLKVATASLGHSHTAVIERDTGRLFCFGDNTRGQVDGVPGSPAVARPACVGVLRDENFVDASAGLFHTAAITSDGELVAFGDDRYGQCGGGGEDAASSAATPVRRWRPDDGCRIVQASCGRRHTAVLDEHGRVWVCGEVGGYGQLGRGNGGEATGGNKPLSRKKKGARGSGPPQLVFGRLGRKGSGCFRIENGWSHIVALVRGGDDSDKDASDDVHLYGWGRNDRGQLGTGTRERSVPEPRLILPHQRALGGESNSVQSLSCGAESTLVVDGDGAVWGTGWNEHGNLGIGGTGRGKGEEDVCEFARVAGEKITRPPPPGLARADHGNDGGDGVTTVAAGGAHFLAIKTASSARQT